MPVSLSNVPAACHASRTSVGPIGSLSSRSVLTAFLTASSSTGASAAWSVRPTPAPTTAVAPAAPAKSERAETRPVAAKRAGTAAAQSEKPRRFRRAHTHASAHTDTRDARENPCQRYAAARTRRVPRAGTRGGVGRRAGKRARARAGGGKLVIMCAQRSGVRMLTKRDGRERVRATRPQRPATRLPTPDSATELRKRTICRAEGADEHRGRGARGCAGAAGDSWSTRHGGSSKAEGQGANMV
jgi:hypothetical protein